MAYSPMMQEYLKTKEQYSDCILFYRLGDFYEMFFDDAVTVSKTLDLVLTSKACGTEPKAPMCGIPYHAVDSYVEKLIDNGYKVAIAEQMVDPSTVKGLVPRDVIRVITPGTIISSDVVSEKDNNYLMAIYFDESVDVSWCDIATGDFCVAHINDDSHFDKLIETIVRVQPREIITNITRNRNQLFWEYVDHLENVLTSTIDCKRLSYEKTAPSMLLAYLKDTQKQDITHLEPLRTVNDNYTMRLDRSTIKNLEITETLYDKNVNGSLFGVLDKCKSAMGSRKMKQWLKEPLINRKKIEARLDAVEEIKNNDLMRNNIRMLLNSIYDLERIIAKISLGSASARDLLALKQSLFVLTDIKDELSVFESPYLKKINTSIDPLVDVYEKIEKAIVEEPPITLREGGLIKRGYSEDLDKINDSIKDANTWINSLEEKERKRTGIKNLKVSFNKVFGYYIEVSKSQLSLVPKEYIRKQTLVNGERFITPKLKDIENILLNAKNQTDELEYKLFNEIKDYIKTKTSIIQKTAIALSVLDVICSFAEVSKKNNYVKPIITETDVIDIKKGRHPVIEKTVKEKEFVANDIYINRSDNSMLLITGPNMAGKSTYMRQLALIILMAQVGCFVPAKEATIGICDRIYTRIGASDNISMGQSTFYVEMSELAYILNTATKNSLIILDEIGRGTSTLDGLAIAWSVVETLTNPEHQIRTLFATHYHELTKLEEKISGIKNLTIDVVEENNEIQFTHRIIEGAANRSYGIQVAKIAGIPKDVLSSAQKKLEMLEENNSIKL